MSIALSTARASVRQLINDVDISPPAIKGYRVDQAISNHYQRVAGRLNMPVAWVTVAALVASTKTYTLTAGDAKEFHSIGLFRIASNLRLVEKIGPHLLEGLRRDMGTGTGEPFAVAITEAAPSAVGTTETTFEVYPTPKVADTLQGLASTAAAVLSDDADKIQLGLDAQRAIEYGAAAELLSSMTAEVAARLQIDKGVARDYGKAYEDFIEAEQTRISRLRSGRFANTSYVSPGRR